MPKDFCSACKSMNAVSAKRCFYCKSKLKDECLPITLSALKAKLHSIANGTDKDNGGIKYHSVLYMIPYDITDKNRYIFSRDGIPKEQGIEKYLTDTAERIQKCIQHSEKHREVLGGETIKENVYWYRVINDGGSENFCLQHPVGMQKQVKVPMNN